MIVMNQITDSTRKNAEIELDLEMTILNST